jgi:hypothetical protein
MTTWIQLKDSVAFASVESPYFVENSIPLEDGQTWEDVKLKKYENGNWIESNKIHFVTKTRDITVPVSETETETLTILVSKESTYFSSEVTGEIISDEVSEMWVKNSNGSWTLPPTVGLAHPDDEANYPL